MLDWTHIAATYDASDAIWRIYLNGQLSNPNARAGNIRSAPKENMGPWTIGSIPTKPFFGKMCDVRIWSCARHEDEIKKCMKVENVSVLQDILKNNALRGYWPCHDGVGLLVSDISQYRHYGFAKDCSWKMDEKRPFKSGYVAKKTNKEENENDGEKKEEKQNDFHIENLLQTEGIVNGKKFVFQPFERQTCAKAVFYTNGEVLVIAYPSHAFWNKSYRGVCQKFELTNNCGLLTDEVEYDDFSNILCAKFVYDCKSMWIYNKSS